MKIEQLGNKYELSASVYEAVALVEKSTGKDIDFELLINLNVDGATKIARKQMPRHILRIKENSTARVNHIIIHECGHILRVMQAKPSDRVVPSSNTFTTNKARVDLNNDLQNVPAEAREEIFHHWLNGLINQLVNLPVDVRIEKWICSTFPTFQNTQKISVAIDAQNCLKGLSDEIQRNTIGPVFNKSNAMVYAYLRGISSITGENYLPYFKECPEIKKIGRKLFACLGNEDRGFVQDIETINAWANILEIEEWFAWIGFEDVPETYYE